MSTSDIIFINLPKPINKHRFSRLTIVNGCKYDAIRAIIGESWGIQIGSECRKAILLLSGGMDSSIAGKLVVDQGIEVIGVKFSSPFCQCDTGGECNAGLVAKNLGVEFKNIPKGETYLEIIRNPRFGYGKNMNPCIDCRIFMLGKTKELMKEIDADFIITGEVLGQRPKSQHREAIELIERESGLDGLLLRPLSTGLLKESIPEKEGWVDSSAWPKLSGRSRKVQYELIGELGIQGCSSPAGGCLLTVKDFARKLKDLFEHRSNITWTDVHRLKVGRHFRMEGRKVVIGRDHSENQRLLQLFKDSGIGLEAVDVPSPIGVIETDDVSRLDLKEQVVKIVAGMVLRYSDNQNDTGDVRVFYMDTDDSREEVVHTVEQVRSDVIDPLRV